MLPVARLSMFMRTEWWERKTSKYGDWPVCTRKNWGFTRGAGSSESVFSSVEIILGSSSGLSKMSAVCLALAICRRSWEVTAVGSISLFAKWIWLSWAVRTCDPLVWDFVASRSTRVTNCCAQDLRRHQRYKVLGVKKLKLEIIRGLLKPESVNVTQFHISVLLLRKNQGGSAWAKWGLLNSLKWGWVPCPQQLLHRSLWTATQRFPWKILK